ncbi:MAG: filamentous hemagglutinin N-terminal domain-containing protein [Cyanobacteria bacterium P01_F01_bin.150]
MKRSKRDKRAGLATQAWTWDDNAFIDDKVGSLDMKPVERNFMILYFSHCCCGFRDKANILLYLAIGLWILMGATRQAYAQVTPDGTLNTTVTSSDNFNFVIEGGEVCCTQAGQHASPNLFHSFDEFSIPSEGSATFNNATAILNIIGRITGGRESDIDGRIKAKGIANLFLINPSGFVFGEDAELDIGGAFFASTADSILFNDGVIFSAIDTTSPPLLTISTPVGLQLGTNPGSITATDSEFELEGQTFGLVGGKITFNGAVVEAAEGRVELFAATDSLVPITSVEGQLALGTQPTVGTWGDISMLDQSEIDNYGNGRGAVQLQGRQISLQERSRIIVENEGSVPSGDINIYGAERVEIAGESSSGSVSRIMSNVDEDATDGGHGGNINIITRQFFLLDGAELRAETESAGDGGDIKITAETVELRGVSAVNGYGVFLRSKVDEQEGATGEGGDIVITAQSFLADDGAFLFAESEGAGDAGNFMISVVGDAIFQGTDSDGTSTEVSTETEASGAGGDLTIQADRIFLRDGVIFDADTEGTGLGGNITLQSRLVSLSGVDGSDRAGGITTEVDSNAADSAQGGDITIDTERLEMVEGAFITAFTRAGGDAGNIIINAQDVNLDGAIESEVGATSIAAGVVGNVDGRGGTITLNVDTLNLRNGATLNTATDGDGDGGSITINAQTININGQSPSGVRSGLTAAVEAEASGQGGQITVNTGTLTISQGGDINTNTAGASDAGQISITSTGTTSIDKGTIQSEAIAGSIGNSGSINLLAQELVLSNQAQVTAANAGQGNAGQIVITTTDGVSLIGQSTISSSIANGIQGNAGRVDITTGERITLRNSRISGEIGVGATGDGGSVTLTGHSLQLNNGATVTTATRGNGNAGDITLRVANRVTMKNESVVSSSVGSNIQGDAGTIVIEAGGAIALDNSTITGDMGIGAEGTGGTLQLRGQSLALGNGSALSTTTSGTGDAGDIILHIDRLTTLSAQSQISSNALAEGNPVAQTAVGTNRQLNWRPRNLGNTSSSIIGNAGNIFLTTGDLRMEDSAIMANNESGGGQGGDMTIIASNRTYLNGSHITAITASGDGGNLNLDLGNLFLFSDGSLISTTAGAAGAGGNGGNIDIAAQYIIGKGNSDISANAFEGQGGRIFITTRGLMGLSFRPSFTSNNDITATSEFGVNGTVDINTPDTTPNPSFIELPDTLIDISQQVRPGCFLEQEQFILAGRGGLPDSPLELMNGDRPWIDLRDLSAFLNNSSENLAPAPPEQPMMIEPLQEAIGMAIAPDGTLQLVPSSSQNATIPHASCTSEVHQIL